MPSTSAPRSRSRRAITSTSPIRGTLVSTHSSSVSRHAASSGSAAFLLPSTATRPSRRCPPSISSVDIREVLYVRIVRQAHEDRLGAEADAEPIQHLALDPHCQGEHVARRRPAAVHDRQRVLRGQSHPPGVVALGEAALLDQPGGRNLHIAAGKRKPRRLAIAGFGRHPAMDMTRHDGVHEERSDAPAVRIRGVDHHALVPPDVEHGRPRICNRRGRDAMPVEVPSHVRIGGRRLTWAQPEPHLAHDEPPGVFALEPAHAVTELTLGVGERDERLRASIEGGDVVDGVAHLLPVGAHVLNRRAADAARNARQALDARQPAAHGSGDHTVPWLPRPGAHERVVAVAREIDAAHVDLRHQSVESAIGDDEIAAAAQHEQLDAPLAGPPVRGRHVLHGACAGEPARGSTDAKRGERGQRRRWAPGRTCAHRSARSLASCAARAAIASARVQSWNSTQSPGASWPASGRSAVMTVAICG